MSVADWDRISTVTRTKILPKIEDVISTSRPFLQHLFKTAKKQDSGEKIHKVVRYQHGTQGRTYGDMEVMNSGQDSNRTRLEWEWKKYANPIVVSNLEIAKNGGTEKVFDLLKADMEDVMLTTEEDLATMFFGDGTGNNNHDLNGLVALVDDGTNVDSWGGATRTTHTWAASYYNASGGTLALATLATAWDACKSGNDVPNMLLTTDALWTAYEQLLEPATRFAFTTNGYPVADGGFKALYYRGAPIMTDDHCPSGYWYFLNTKYIELEYLAHPSAKSTGAKCLYMSDMLQPPTQDGTIGYIHLYGNVINTHSARSGVIRGLS